MGADFKEGAKRIVEGACALADRFGSFAKAAAPYATGILLGLAWFHINWPMITGYTLWTHLKVQPAVSSEMVGRILGYVDSAFLMYLAWLYQTSRSSQDKNEMNAKANELASKALDRMP